LDVCRIDSDIEYQYNTFSGIVTNVPYTFGPLGKQVNWQHGITVFDGAGNTRTAVKNSKTDEIDLNRIDFIANASGERPKLGKYTIKFLDSENFTVSQPDGALASGNINSTFLDNFLSIQSGFWNLTGDPTGVEIELWCYMTVFGNPISVVKNLIYKALTGNWGFEPVEDPALSVNWIKLNCLEGFYTNTQVYISETNKDNKVFSPQSSDKPLRARDLIQKILDHIGCQFTFDDQGQITVNTSHYLCPGESVRQYDSCHLSTGPTRKSSAH